MQSLQSSQFFPLLAVPDNHEKQGKWAIFDPRPAGRRFYSVSLFERRIQTLI